MNFRSYLPTRLNPRRSGSWRNLLTLVVGALGVVYGDIGTSPLYSISEIFINGGLKKYSPGDIIGAISLVIWALTIIVALKYVIFVLRADSEGEGGVFALYDLISAHETRHFFLIGLLVIAAGLLYGDGIITPSISVLSAVEGLGIITSSFAPYVVPLTLIILTVLFMIQQFGTHKIGKIFGPVMMIWFFFIAVLGFNSLRHNPTILSAFNPYFAVNFLFSHHIMTDLLVLGSVFLVITGGEAMYADMGHFGRLPIRLGWYLVAYPALVTNYLGQGAYLLSGRTVVGGSVFYSMVPQALLLPSVILATAATIIASQALISGAFSLTMQAISLRLLPYLSMKHTNEKHGGQIYIGAVNWLLYAGTVLLVLFFHSSKNLASAYGLAVSGVMVVTTMGIISVAKQQWKWSQAVIYVLFTPLLILEGIFLISNSLKFFQGGYIPVMVGLTLFTVVKVWQWGRAHTIRAFDAYPSMKLGELIRLQQQTPNDYPQTNVFLTSSPVESPDDRIPIQLQRNWERNEFLAEHIVLLNVSLQKTPHAAQRSLIRHFTAGKAKNGSVTSIRVQFGFMEDPYIEPLVRQFIDHHDIPSTHPPEKWIFKAIHERPILDENSGFFTRLKFNIYLFLHRVTDKADDYFSLGKEHNLLIDVFPVKLI